MAYKDKDRQREAVKLATRRYRDRLKGITRSSSVIPKTTASVIPSESTLEVVAKIHQLVKPQSYNPMMVGYVPPQD